MLRVAVLLLICSICALKTDMNGNKCSVPCHEQEMWQIARMGVGAAQIRDKDFGGVICIDSARKELCPIEVNSYHISGTTHIAKGNDLAGIVLYSYKSKSKWKLNGLNMQSGYIYLTDSATASKKFPNQPGMVHGAAYKELTGESVGPDVFGSGFAIMSTGEWKFNSFTFNANGAYTDNIKTMKGMEQHMVKSAVEYWMATGNPTLMVADMPIQGPETLLDYITFPSRWLQRNIFGFEL